MRFLECLLSAFFCALLVPVGLTLIAFAVMTLAGFLASALLCKVCMACLCAIVDLSSPSTSPLRRR